jgi:hypothetical protein
MSWTLFFREQRLRGDYYDDYAPHYITSITSITFPALFREKTMLMLLKL